MAAVRWTDESVFWLKNIYNFISVNGYPDRARKFVSDLIDKGDSLASMPERGSIYINRDGKDIRVIYYGHYRIAYWFNNETVFILGVFNGRMQLENYLHIIDDI